MSPKKGLIISVGNTSSNHWFSVDMLVLRGVKVHPEKMSDASATPRDPIIMPEKSFDKDVLMKETWKKVAFMGSSWKMGVLWKYKFPFI